MSGDSAANLLKRSGDCFAPAEVLYTSQEGGRQSGTGLLGNLVEMPIVRHYIAETNRIPLGLTALVSDHDWWDTGSEEEYIKILLKRHKHLKRSMFPSQTFQWPDILTFNGVTLFTSIPGASGGRPQSVPLVRGRHEFYEIKPDSDTGKRDGDLKLVGIIDNYRPKNWALPYRPGDTYPAAGEKNLALPLNRQFTYLAQLFMKNYNIKHVRIYLQVRRSKPGLLLYKICIEIETDDKRRQQALAKAAAKHLYAAFVVCHAPLRFKAIEQELGDYSFEGEKIPRIRCAFSVLEQLAPLKQSIEQALYMRGIAYPQETWMLYCDEPYYQRLVAPPPSVRVREIWQKLTIQAERWTNYAAGSAGWAEVKPLILKAEAAAVHFEELFPGSEDFVNHVLSWIHDHPYEVIAIVTVGIILTASVAALIEAGLLAATLTAAEVTVVESSAPTVISGLGRIAMTESVAGQTFGVQVARGAAARGLLKATEVSGQIGGLGQAANETSILVRTLSNPAVIDAVKKAGVGIAASVVLGVNISTARAAGSSKSPAATTTDKPDEKSEGPLIAHTISCLRAVRQRLGPGDALRPPYKGELVDIGAFADKPLNVGDVTFERPAKVLMRYVGSVTVT